MGNLAFNAVPEGFSEADGDVFHHALHNAAQGVAIGLCRLERLRPLIGLLDAPHLRERSMEAGKIEHLFGHDAGGNNPQCEPAAEMASAARVVEAAELEVGRKIRMPRTGMLPELLVVLAAGILVAEQDGERCACSMALVYAGDNFRLV